MIDGETRKTIEWLPQYTEFLLDMQKRIDIRLGRTEATRRLGFAIYIATYFAFDPKSVEFILISSAAVFLIFIWGRSEYISLQQLGWIRRELLKHVDFRDDAISLMNNTAFLRPDFFKYEVILMLYTIVMMFVIGRF